MRFSDRINAIFFIIFGAAIILWSQRFTITPGAAPRLVPDICGVLMIICGACLLLRGLWRKSHVSEHHFLPPLDAITPAAWLRMLGIVLSVIFAIYLVPILGAYLSSFIIVVVNMLLWKTKWWVTIITALLSSLVIVLFFTHVLNVVLPMGLLEGVLQ